MANIFIYFVLLPTGISEAVISGVDQFTIYIDSRLSEEQKQKAYRHAMWHIQNGDFDYNCDRSVQEVEYEAHKMVG